MVSARAWRLVVGMLGDILGAGSRILVSLPKSRSSARLLAILFTLSDTSAATDTSSSCVLALWASELVDPWLKVVLNLIGDGFWYSRCAGSVICHQPKPSEFSGYAMSKLFLVWYSLCAVSHTRWYHWLLMNLIGRSSPLRALGTQYEFLGFRVP